MTVNEIYKAAISILGELPDDCVEFEAFTISHINRLIIDTFNHNNSVLHSRDMELLEEPPLVESTEDEVSYDKMLVAECFPYGLAVLLCSDEDREKYNMLNFEFSTRLSKYLKAEYNDFLEEE